MIFEYVWKWAYSPHGHLMLGKWCLPSIGFGATARMICWAIFRPKREGYQTVVTWTYKQWLPDLWPLPKGIPIYHHWQLWVNCQSRRDSATINGGKKHCLFQAEKRTVDKNQGIKGICLTKVVDLTQLSQRGNWLLQSDSIPLETHPND